jgi:superfamily II DNA or RNA helicase
VPEFKPGDEVRLKADPEKQGIILGEPFVRGGIGFVKLRLLSGGGGNIQALVDELEPIVQAISGRERLLAGQHGLLRNLRARLTYEKLANPLRDVLYSLKASRTDFLPHQFKPVLKFLESPANGLLIADEVGLGKTIEAGYILKELRARHRQAFRRALVVCPAGLRVKWTQELNRRFAEPFELADARRLREVASKIETNGDREEFALVTSYQTLRSRSVRDSIESLGPINLTIIDEAHHFRNPSTQTHEVAECLREISDNLIMLSATPVQLGDHNLHALLQLIAPDLIGDYNSFQAQFRANRTVLAAARTITGGGDGARAEVLALLDGMLATQDAGLPLAAVQLVRDRVATADLSLRESQLELRGEIRELSPLSTLMSRTRKRDVDARHPERTALQPEVTLTAEERCVYEFFTAETRRRYGAATAAKARQTSRFRSIAMQQQMASCLPAFLRTRVVGADGLVEYDDPRSIDDLDEELTEEEMEARAMRIREAEEVTSAINAILASGIDSKFDQLLSVIQRVDAMKPNGKLVVFSFYKRTLGYLAERLRRAGIGFELISGDVPSSPENRGKDERGSRVERFHKDPSVRVLLSSEVGSEGLDFQKASNVVVHYDLPWNPMKVEQRIGRVDRHGQPDAVVYTVAFAIPDTLEERIRKVLYERIGVFRETIGDLEDIISERLHAIEEVVMSPDLSEVQRSSKLQQISDAMIGQAQERQRLEDSEALLMGHDDTFDQELALLEKSGRSMSAEEIADFVEGAIEGDGVPVVPIRQGGRRAARVDNTSRLQEFLRKNLPKSALGRIALLSENPRTAVELDYRDSEAVHFVTAHHPLVHAAIEVRRQSLGSRDEPVAAIKVQASALGSIRESLPRSRNFAFALTRLTDVGSIRDSYSIAADVVDFFGSRLPVSIGEQLVQAALNHGADADSLSLPPQDAEFILEHLEHAADARRSDRESELRARHSRSLEMRLQSQRSRAATELGRIKSRIGGADFDSRQPRYRNMILGQRRNLEEQLRKIDAEFTNPRLPTVTFARFGFGLIEVVS